MSTLLVADCEAYCVKITDDTGRIWIARNRRELANIRDILPKVPMTCCSSLDWPEDYTTDLDVIDVCNIIRGNTIRAEDVAALHESERENYFW